MNQDWLDGKHPAIREVLEESKRMTEKKGANGELSGSDGAAHWLSGWGVYWFVSLLLAYYIGWGLLTVACFIALIKWFGQGREKDRQAQTDKLYDKMKKEISFPIADAARKDTVNNGNYNYNFENVLYRDPWKND